MKPKLIIISDLFGKQDMRWVEGYRSHLSNAFQITVHDACDLAEIDPANLSEEKIHEQFVNGGIEKAVENLCRIENEPSSVLAFSVGGAIVWKAMLKGLKANCFVAVSSTRLRYESKKPSKNIHLVYGELDMYQPKEAWYSKLNLSQKSILEKASHTLYKESKYVAEICALITAKH